MDADERKMRLMEMAVSLLPHALNEQRLWETLAGMQTGEDLPAPTERPYEALANIYMQIERVWEGIDHRTTSHAS